MTDGQFATLMAVLAAFGSGFLATARWAVNRITNVIEENSKTHKAQAEKFAELSLMVKFAFDSSQKVNDRLVEENSGVHEAAVPREIDLEDPAEPEPTHKRNTPAHGYPTGHGIHGLKRAGTKGAG